MATGEPVLSFDAIIQTERQRKKAEALANEIFGAGRRSSLPAKNGHRKATLGPSLASRVGVGKTYQRSASAAKPKVAANVDEPRLHHEQHMNNSQIPRVSRLPPSNNSARTARDNRLFAAFHSQSPPISNGTITSNKALTVHLPSKGFNIRGLAGPYIVCGSNFAPGTTAADIESAMEPVGGEIQSCRVLTSTPTVIAEMTFTEKTGAENVVSTFNNQKADGRILHIYMKQGPSTPLPASSSTMITPTQPRADRPNLDRGESWYTGQRDRNVRRADPEFQDGRFGFETRDETMDVDLDERKDIPRNIRRDDHGARENRSNGLYSDDLYPRLRGRGFRA